MAYQRFDGTMSFLPSRFEAQAMLYEMQKKKDEEMKLLRLKQAEEQKQQTEALRSELNRMLAELRAMTANREATMTKFVSQTSTTPRPPFPPPDPPDIRKSRQDLTIKAPDPPDFNQSELILAIQTPNKLALRYSCEEIHERMTNGLCILCEELDTPGHYNLKHKRSKLCLVESVGDESPDDEKLDEVTVKEISNKPVNMIQVGESNSENESRLEVSILQFQVPLSHLEPSRRCHKESLDFVDKRMCNELAWDEDGDSIITMSAKCHQTYEDPRFELVSLEQPHDPVEIHLDNSEYALIRSSLIHTPTCQYRAPSNPYQNCNDQCHYKREFGNYTGSEIEFDRASEEVEDDELQDKQTEDNNSVVENQKKLARKIEILVYENLHKPSRPFDDESQRTLGEHTPVPMKSYQSYSRSWYELDTIQSDINFKVLVAHECDMVGVMVIYEVTTTFEKLAKTWKFKFKSNSERIKLLDDMFSFMEKSSEKYVMVRESHHISRDSQQGNGLSLLNCLIAHDVLRLCSSEYTKHTLILVYHLRKHSSSCLFLNTSTVCIGALLMVYDAKRLIQLDEPPVFNELMCVMNRIRVRLKLVLLLEFLWLILFTSKIFKSSSVPQNNNQTDQKLSSYWKLLLRLLHPLHTNRWRSFYLLVIKSLVKGKEETVSSNNAVTSCSRFDFFPYSSSSCALRQEENCVLVLFPVGEALTLVNDQHTLVAQKKGTEASTGCCYGSHADLDLMADVTDGTADISMDEFSSVCKLLFGVFVLNLIADQVRDWSFFGLLLQWKWHPPPQATSEFHQAHNDKPVFHL